MPKPSAKGKKKKTIKVKSHVVRIEHKHAVIDKKGVMVRDPERKLRRNETCPLCKSGKKYKHCCEHKLLDKQKRRRFAALIGEEAITTFKKKRNAEELKKFVEKSAASKTYKITDHFPIGV